MATSVPRPTLASFDAFLPVPVHDLPTIELVDEVGGTWFEIWIPRDARTARYSPNEIVVARTGLQMAIAQSHDIPLDHEAALWRTAGALVLRAVPLADGYLVTALRDRCLDVVRLVRHRRATLRVQVHMGFVRRAGWQPQACAEALCASLQIR